VASRRALGSPRRDGDVGGCSSSFADWLLDADPSSDTDREALIGALTDFYDAVLAGLRRSLLDGT